MTSHLDELQGRLGADWSSIRGARSAAADERARLRTNLQGCGTTDAAIVAFGSLAREEVTSGSDLDWTLLVDGPAKRDHWPSVHRIRDTLTASDTKPPNPSGAFGTMAFSHELVHRIGGDSDTNRITTQRVLLLLESVPIGPSAGAAVHERVVRSVLDSYLGSDPVTHDRIPHVLLNDVVRYWRTVTVDFAAKARERGHRGWAIRNLKLRTARKLIFAAGLALCLRRVHSTPEDARRDDSPEARAALLDVLVQDVQATPSELLARVAAESPETMDPLAGAIFSAYDRFLALVDDPTRRAALEKLIRADEANDPTWTEAKAIGRDFGRAVQAFFFDPRSLFADAITRYGVF
ncbi:MAG: nucleotidyltransferase domain-containing protein [Planctomycetota bacterium]